MDNLREVSSTGWDGVQASCGCRWPCCLGGSPGLQTTARDLGGAEIQLEIHWVNTQKYKIQIQIQWRQIRNANAFENTKVLVFKLLPMIWVEQSLNTEIQMISKGETNTKCM